MKTYATKIWHVSGIESPKRANNIKICSEIWIFCSNELSYPDSNQDKQNQNLLCYHYTIRQLPYVPCGTAKIGINPELAYREPSRFYSAMSR